VRNGASLAGERPPGHRRADRHRKSRSEHTCACDRKATDSTHPGQGGVALSNGCGSIAFNHSKNLSSVDQNPLIKE
jgi:hypothetical protein